MSFEIEKLEVQRDGIARETELCSKAVNCRRRG
jgi:hypothetical protein